MKIKDRVLYSKAINWEELAWFKPDNYKSSTTEDLTKLENSLRKNHYIDPFKVWFDEKNNTIFILDGTRKKTALSNLQDQGCEIPKMLTALFIDCKTKKQAAALVLAYDSVYGKVNNEGLKEFHDLFELDYSETSLYANIPSIDASYFNPAGYDEEAFEKVPEVPKTSLSKTGDLFIIDGKHRILCGDSRCKDDFKKLFAGTTKAKLVITSPPYNQGKKYIGYKDKLKAFDFIKFNLDCMENVKRHLNGFIFWNLSYSRNMRQEFIDILYRSVHEIKLNFLEWIAWDKTAAIPLCGSKKHFSRQVESIFSYTSEDCKDVERILLSTSETEYYFNKRTKQYLSNYWRIPSVNSSTEFHKAAFPVKLVTQALELMTAPDDIVADCFLGTGTTIVAANLLNRVGYGIELDPIYVDLILKRYKQLYPKAKFKCENRKFNFKKLFNQ